MTNAHLKILPVLTSPSCQDRLPTQILYDDATANRAIFDMIGQTHTLLSATVEGMILRGLVAPVVSCCAFSMAAGICNNTASVTACATTAKQARFKTTNLYANVWLQQKRSNLVVSK